jgi:hypothetical protein
MTQTRSLVALAILIFILFFACDKQDEKIPSYIYIKPFSFLVKTGQGTTHQNISDGWVYVNGNYYGAYQLPVWLPLLESGSSEVSVFPGIRLNGSISHAVIYSLLDEYKIQLNLNPGKTDTIMPVTAYQDQVVISTIKDFEGNPSFTIDLDNNINTKVLVTNPAEAFEGIHSGLIELTASDNLLHAEDLENLVIPQSGEPIIVEISYRSDIPFQFGFKGYDSFGGSPDELLNAVILPKKDWTKIYFDFREILNFSNSDHYHLVVAAQYNKDSSQTIQRVLIDNIKVLHR